ALIKAYRISYLADVIAGISLDAFSCKPEPFHHLIHRIRPHEGQLKTAGRIMRFLEGSALMAAEKTQVQDPYSFRCIPQVHGATKDSLSFVEKTLVTEINSVTDNPNIFVDEDTILSGGNFHGQPLALALDYLGIAMAELGSISERRTYQLVSGARGLPEFLVHDPGLNSGLMIPQYTAAAIVSQNKQLAVPASVDSITSSNGQEDHVSMGANAAVKALQIVDNVERILAIELLTAAQALEFRKPLRSSGFIENFTGEFKEVVPFVEKDRVLHTDIMQAVAFMKNYHVKPEILFE
ncbi:MAG: aromatic amino acid lyase, partial [Sinomicrobium sp.]|nr:aromatic amino acid lyase [Sinomicrobium sp.]